MTLQAWHGRRPSHAPQAVLITGGDFSGEDGIVMVAQEAPAFGVRAGRSEVHRAVLVGDQFDAPSGNPDRAAQRYRIGRVTLGGGCFYNGILRDALSGSLAARGLQVLEAQSVSPGDSAISLGQAWVALQSIKQEI